MHNNVPYMKTSLCANVKLDSTNLGFNLKSSLMPFFHWAVQLEQQSSRLSLVLDGKDFLCVF